MLVGIVFVFVFVLCELKHDTRRRGAVGVIFECQITGKELCMAGIGIVQEPAVGHTHNSTENPHLLSIFLVLHL